MRWVEYTEVHSQSGKSFIRKTEARRWNVHVDGVHVATFFTREDARKFIRASKDPGPRLGFQTENLSSPVM